jgi:hypothetical protein
MSATPDRRRWVRSLACGFACAALGALALLAPGHARARVAFSSAYTLEQNFSAALRLIRVDMGLRITEKDPEAAYVLFEYRSNESGARVTPGSIEMVPRSDTVQVTVQLPQMPQYHEDVMATALKKKLLNDYGEPPRRRPSPPSRPDAGADAEPDAGSVP